MKYFLVHVFCIVAVTLLGQSTVYKQIDAEKGLPVNEVYYITQDKVGYIWMATSNGICRYNGNSFETFENSPDKPSEEIIEIHGSSSGRVWLFALSGNIYYRENNQFFSAKENPKIKHLQTDYMTRVFYQDRLGEEYFGNYKYGASSLKMKAFKQLGCLSILEFEGETIAAGTNSFYSLTGDYEWKGDFKLNNAFRFIKYKNGVLAISGNGNLNYYDLKNKKLTKLKMSEGFSCKIVYDLAVNDQNQLYCGTSNGLYTFTIANDEQIILNHNLVGIPVSNIFFDSQKNLWLASLNKGVYFQSCFSPEVLSYNTTSDEIVGFHLGNDLLFAQHGTIYRSDYNSQSLYFDFKDESMEITSILKKGNKVIFGSNRGVHQMVNSKFVGEYHYFDSLENRLVNLGSIKNMVSHHDTIYIASIRGVFRIDRMDNDMKAIKIVNGRTNDLLISNHILWIAQENGIYTVQKSKLEPIMTGSFRALIEHNGAIYVGGYGNGITKISNGKQTRIQSASSPKKYTCNDLVVHAGTLYAATNLGVGILDRNNKFYFIDKNSGLPHNYINKIQLGKNLLFFSTKSGLFSVNHSQSIIKRPPPKIILDEVRINNSATKLERLMSLSYRENNIALVFDILHYSGGEVVYQYNINDGWIDLESPLLILGKLTPGNYEIQFRAKGRYSDWSSPLSVKVNISPPFWSSTWFKLLIALCIIGILYLFFRIRILSYNRDIVREILLSIQRRIKKEKIIVVKHVVDGKNVKLKISEISYVVASKNYCELKTAQGEIVIRANLKEFLESCEHQKVTELIRIHRSYAVNPLHITAIGAKVAYIKDEEIPVGKSAEYVEWYRKIKKEFSKNKI